MQDDAREYVFWMQRFVNPDLFAHDLIADYFQSITPIGYASTYRIVASLGFPPLYFSKILPIILGLIITAYCFGLCLQLFPVPVAGFFSTLLLNQSLWFKDDLVSATPRAFIYPLFLAFLYYLLRRSWVAVCLTVVLQGLFYPPLLFLSVSVLCLRLVRWQRWWPRLTRKRGLYVLLVVGVGFLSVLPFIMASAEFGPVVTAVEAKTMPEFWPGGRHPFFDPNAWKFWFIGEHSGILPPLLPPLIWIGLFLPFVQGNLARFPLAFKLRDSIIVPQLLAVALSLFFAAHALLLKLFFPTRYTVHTLRIVMALAAGMTIVIFLDAILSMCVFMAQSHQVGRLLWILSTTVAIGIALILYPHISKAFPATNYRLSNENLFYEFLQKQPQESLISTLSDEANNIPTFAQRPVLIGKEYALPFHLGYYQQIRQRSSELIYAQYSPDLTPSQQLIQKYGVDFWLLDRTAFTANYLDSKSWLRSFQSAFQESNSNLKQGTTPALETVSKRCSVFESESLVLLDARCILKIKP
ncbi:MAG: hypothetical protein ACAF41_14610 [Leptolyngbya sp. BL-A-14]